MRNLLGQLTEHARSGADTGRRVASEPARGPDPGAILKALYAYDRTPEEGRNGSKIIHASSFCHNPKCARMLCLTRSMREQGVTFTETPFGSSRLVWAYGRAAEQHVRTALLANPEIRRAVRGLWRCRCGHSKAVGLLPVVDAKCPRCKTVPDQFGELSYFDNDAKISGSPDLPLLQHGAYTVIEIKSIKADNANKANEGFESTETPQPKHVEQACHYVRLMRHNGLPVHRVPVILYVNKGFSSRTWYKALTPSPELLVQCEEEVELAVAAAREYAQAYDAGPEALPAKLPLCAARPNALEKKCPAWAECIAHG